MGNVSIGTENEAKKFIGKWGALNDNRISKLKLKLKYI